MSITDSTDPDITTKKDFGEKCGVCAVFTKSLFAPQLVRRASLALQHRGPESAGIAIYSEPSKLKKRLKLFGSNGFIKAHIGMGLVSKVLSDELIRSLGPSHSVISHNRYSTTGGSSLMNAQPISSKSKTYRIAIAHNGNIPDITFLKSQVKHHPQADSDTALMAAYLAEQRPKYKSWEETFINALPNIRGAYSLTVLTEDGTIFGIRDPWGIRPLSLGELEDGYIIASESVALDAVGASFIRDIKQGEIIKIDREGNLSSYFYGDPKRQQLCLLEHIYFSRPDSFINNKRIKTLRESSGKALGRRLRKKGIKADLVVPIFNSGYFAAQGVAQELKLPLIDAVVTSGYFGRTFINLGQELRRKAVGGKHNIIPDEILGKNIIFVDDAAIRFNTSAILTQNLREAGAAKIYAAFASPPVVNQCNMGISMRTKEELPASKYEHKPIDFIESKMRDLIKVDDLTFLPLDETCQAMQGEIKDFYTYPFGGRHPVFNRQEVFQKRNSHKNLAIKMIVLAKKGKKTQRLTGLLTGFDFLKVEFVATELELLKKAERTKIDLVLILGFE